jgi:alkaline phosphatase D
MLLLLQLGRLVCFLASLNLKWNAFVFLRYVIPAFLPNLQAQRGLSGSSRSLPSLSSPLLLQLPLGYRFLPKIFTSLAVYIPTYFVILLYSPPPPKLSKKNERKPARRARATLLALLIGVPPNTSSILLHGSFLFLNLLPVLFSLDFMYRAYYLHPSTYIAFSRVGHTTASSARVLLRSPTSHTPFNFTHSSSLSSLTVSVEPLTDSTDFTTTLHLQDLLPDTVYTYSSSLGHAGSFTTTRSEDDLDKFTILSSSCLKPGWPYVPWEDSRAIRGVDALNGFVASMERKPEAMLFLGDWICERCIS